MADSRSDVEKTSRTWYMEKLAETSSANFVDILKNKYRPEMLTVLLHFRMHSLLFSEFCLFYKKTRI